MYMHTYGNQSDPAVVLLHPMGITAEKLYEIVGQKLTGGCRLLIPDMGNHGMEKAGFLSAEDEAESICKYLESHGVTELAMIYGASMGAAVALRMLSHGEIKVRSLFLDGAPIAKLGFIMSRVFAPVLIWQKGIYEKNDQKKLAEFIARWGEDLNDHIRGTFMQFSDTSIRNIAQACVKGNGVSRHYDGSPAFRGIDDECAQIKAWVLKNHGGRIHGMVGLSLGGTIAVSILSRGRIRIDRTVLDAAFCVDMGILRGLYGWVFPKSVIRVRDGKPIPGFLIDLFMGKGNRSMVEMIYPGIALETCKSACREVYAYRVSDNLSNTASAVEFWRGSREAHPKKGAALLKARIPAMTERAFPGMGHCQFLHEHPEEYAALLDRYMSGITGGVL